MVGEAQPHSIAVFSSSLVGGVGHVAWVDAANGRQITITEMNTGTGATVANGYHTTGFHVFDTRTVEDVPGIGYILIPRDVAPRGTVSAVGLLSRRPSVRLTRSVCNTIAATVIDVLVSVAADAKQAGYLDGR